MNIVKLVVSYSYKTKVRFQSVRLSKSLAGQALLFCIGLIYLHFVELTGMQSFWLANKLVHLAKHS